MNKANGEFILITLRKANNNDYNFIISSWLRSVRASDTYAQVSDDIFFRRYRPIVERLIANSKTLLACNRDDESQILGFLVYDLNPTTIHYAYVKQVFRKFKIFTRLYDGAVIPGEETLVTHWCNNAVHISRSRNVVYDPWAIND